MEIFTKNKVVNGIATVISLCWLDLFDEELLQNKGSFARSATRPAL